jgi:hypothetical protein
LVMSPKNYYENVGYRTNDTQLLALIIAIPGLTKISEARVAELAKTIEVHVIIMYVVKQHYDVKAMISFFVDE